MQTFILAASASPRPVIFLPGGIVLLGFLSATSQICARDATQLSGDALSFALPTFAVGLTIGLKDRAGTWEFVESAGVTMAVTYALKYSVNETRPNGGGQSFPSGHTSISFSSAEFLRERYGWEYGIPAYALASYVGYTRVEARAHHPHDVITGAGIGILSSYIFTKPYHGWNVQVDGDTKSVGFCLSREW